MSAGNSEQNPSGLGMMPSMSAECTPLKHKYDACFNRWFEDYLGVGTSASAAGSSTARQEGSSGHGRGGLGSLFGRGGSSSSDASSSESSSTSSLSTLTSQATSMTSGTEPAERSASNRKRLRERLDGECGAVWKDYQQCVLRAVKQKDLEGPIAEARAHNPFPFPADVPRGQPNNEPFPFPAGPGGR